MTKIQQCVQTVRRRQQLQWLWKCCSLGLLAGGLLACGMGLSRWLLESGPSAFWIIGTLLAGPFLGAVVALCRRYSLREAAFTIDQVCGLKDRTQTALGFLGNQPDQPLHRLQIDDANRHISQVDPTRVAPFSRPKSFAAGIAVGMIALMLLAFLGGKGPLEAAPTVSTAALASATALDHELDELRDFQKETKDPEVEELLRELAEMNEFLKQEAHDPKEALAKLSEMEASIQEMQKQLDAEADARLAQVGEVLSLAQEMQAAGKAMSSGEMEKAEEELAKLELPKLDQKTERAITEQLDQLRDNNSAGKSRQQLSEALDQLSAGLSRGDRSKFKDGMKGLASECKSQGQRKKLSDLLRKQCQCLGECKSQCEGECQGDKVGKGGKNAGSGKSGNPSGEKTARLKTNPEMNLTGQDSGQGSSEIETEEGPARQQEAIRRYQEQAQEYEAMSESVLNSESIPLGHRQTIRRYFESIRPQSAETDEVFEQTGSLE
ncbi:MAG: hypothetical protein WDZ51_16695 [Pirellulaceae bacterium]